MGGGGVGKRGTLNRFYFAHFFSFTRRGRCNTVASPSKIMKTLIKLSNVFESQKTCSQMTNESRHKHTKVQNTGINTPPPGRGGVFHGRRLPQDTRWTCLSVFDLSIRALVIRPLTRGAV